MNTLVELKKSIQACKEVISLCKSSNGEYCLLAISPRKTGFARSMFFRAIQNNVRSILPKGVYGTFMEDGEHVTVEVSPEHVPCLVERMEKKYIVSILSDSRIDERQSLSPRETQCKKTRRVTACTSSTRTNK